MSDPVESAPPTEAQQALIDQIMRENFTNQLMQVQSMISGSMSKAMDTAKEDITS